MLMGMMMCMLEMAPVIFWNSLKTTWLLWAVGKVEKRISMVSIVQFLNWSWLCGGFFNA